MNANITLQVSFFFVIVNDLSSYKRYLQEVVARERPKQDSNPDLSDANSVHYQLSYQANWELVIIWVYYKPVDSEDW